MLENRRSNQFGPPRPVNLGGGGRYSRRSSVCSDPSGCEEGSSTSYSPQFSAGRRCSRLLGYLPCWLSETASPVGLSSSLGRGRRGSWEGRSPRVGWSCKPCS